ncbi:surface antigen, partial [mine drainage metagenome]
MSQNTPSCGLSHNITAFNGYTNDVIKNISLTSRSDCPREAAVTPNGSELYIPTCCGNNITVINTRTLNVIGNISVPVGRSIQVLFNRNGTIAYDLNFNLTSLNLTEINPMNMKVISNIPLGIGPTFTKMAISANNTILYLIHDNSNNIKEINLNNMKIIGGITLIGACKMLVPSSSYYTSIIFRESGLPEGTLWNATIENQTFKSTTSNISAYTYFGNQEINVSSSDGFNPLTNNSEILNINSSS